MPDPAPRAIEVDGLVVAYGSTVAVNGLDLQADRGEIVALLGRNGAGKTSTVETLEGYRQAKSGSVRVLGRDPARPEDHRDLTRRVGVMLQRGGVYPAMGPAEALTLFASYYDNPADPADLLVRLGLVDVARTPWRRLSGGEQQRLSLGLALIGRPEVVFLDEPTAGVDPQGRLAIRGEMAALRDTGVCVLLTTHELEEAERIADRIVIIDKGQVVATGSPAELTTGTIAAQQTNFSASSGLDTGGLSAVLTFDVTEEAPGVYLIQSAGTPQLVAALSAWLAERDVTMTDLRSGHERLEDVFLRLTAPES